MPFAGSHGLADGIFRLAEIETDFAVHYLYVLVFIAAARIVGSVGIVDMFVSAAARHAETPRQQQRRLQDEVQGFS